MASASVNKDLTISANFLRMSKFQWIGADTIRHFHRLDIKLSQDLHWNKGKTNLSLIVHNLTDERLREFDDENNMFRRGYIQLSHEFD